MSNQLQITGDLKVKTLTGALTASSGVVASVALGGANGVATLDSGGKIPVSQLPNSVMEYKGSWDASTNTPTLADGTGNAGDVYICSVAGTVNFGSGPITFAVGDQVIYNGTIWQKIGAGAGSITGSGTSGEIAYFNGTSSITSEAAFIYDASTNRLGVNTSVPNATIGANSALDSGYGLLIKTGSSNYNGIGVSIDSTYGNLISTEKLGTAIARNLTLLNQSGFVSLKENGNFGVNTLNPSVAGTGIDIYGSTSVGLRFHTATSGTTVSDGAGINYSAANNLGITNYENGAIDLVSNGYSGVYISNIGYVGINGATPTSALTVTGAITQSSVTSSLLKTNASGTLVAAVAGTDYATPSALSGYLPLAGGTLTGALNGTSASFSSSVTAATDLISSNGTLYISAGSGLSYSSRLSTVYNFPYVDTYLDSFGGASYEGRLNFRTNSGGGAMSTKMIILNNGSVGIGTDTPEALLHLNKATSGGEGAYIFIDNSAGSALGNKSGIRFGNNTGTSFSKYDTYIEAVNVNAGNGAASLTFGTWNGSSRGERMIIASDGNVGIGTSNPTNLLHLVATAPILAIESNTTGNVFLRMLQSGTVVSSMFYNNATSTLNISNNNDGIQFNTSAITNAMNITSAGALCLGTATPYSSNLLNINGSVYSTGHITGVISSNVDMFTFINTNGGFNKACFVGSVSVAGSTGSYFFYGQQNTSTVSLKIFTNGDIQNTNNSYGAISDERLKENIIDATPKLADLMKVKVRNYNLKGETNKQLGVISQELEEIFPNMIIESTNMGENMKIKGIKYSVFVPMLIKAIQELKAEVDELKGKIG